MACRVAMGETMIETMKATFNAFYPVWMAVGCALCVWDYISWWVLLVIVLSHIDIKFTFDR